MKKFTVTGMSCAACSARVDKAVRSLPEVRDCSVNLLRGTLSVDTDLADEKIIEAVRHAGYGAAAYEAEAEKASDRNIERSMGGKVILRLISSLIILLPLMYISMGHVMLSAPLPSALSDDPTKIALLEMILSALILIINQKFFINGFMGAMRLAPNMDTLVALGSGVSFIYSVSVIFKMISADLGAAHYLHDLYFESAAMILTLITVGKMLEERAKGKTANAIKELMDMSPKTALVERDGKLLEIPAERLTLGDVFVIRTGDVVPCDGVIIEGGVSVVEAALTGESVPADKGREEGVYGATVVSDGYARCKATSVGRDTRFSAVLRLVEEASATKAPIAKIADKVSGFFVPTIILISLVTFFGWLIYGVGVTAAIGHGIAVLVISCPCALGLATPVAIMVGSGVGARLGVLYKSAESLELCGRAKTVVLDKTGTVTVGVPEVVLVKAASGISETELLEVAYSLEDKSNHPQARAIVEFCGGRVTKNELKDYQSVIGKGVSGNYLQTIVYGGSEKYIAEITRIDKELSEAAAEMAAEGITPLFFARGERVLGLIGTRDKIREDSRRAISDLKKMGMKVVMLTGDNSRVAKAVSEECGIDEVISEVMPEEKAEAVKKYSALGRVIMVGDGVNDAPALALADVGIAIGEGTDVAIESSDVVLLGSSLSDLPRAVSLSRSVLKNIKENLFFAFVYNLLCIPMAAGLFGFTLSPMIGALAMSLSSFSVVSNALRLNGFSRKHRAKSVNGSEVAKDPLSDDKKTSFSDIRVLKIKGMMCSHCEKRVNDALCSVEGVREVSVSYLSGEARVRGSFDERQALEAVKDAGYKVLDIK